MTHIVLFDAIWRRIESYLIASSMPSDGSSYEIKFWVIHHLTEPLLQVMYRFGLTTHKPMIAYEIEDLLEDFDDTNHEDS